MRKKIALYAWLLVLPLAAAADVPARPGDEGPNVLLTLALSEGGSERPIQALVLDGQRVRTSTGWRVPTPAAVTAGAAGMEVTLHVRIVGPGRVRTSGEVDLGTIVGDEAGEPRASGAPTVATFRHVFDVILADGVRTTLAEVPQPSGGSAVLTVSADIQE